MKEEILKEYLLEHIETQITWIDIDHPTNTSVFSSPGSNYDLYNTIPLHIPMHGDAFVNAISNLDRVTTNMFHNTHTHPTLP